ncbi:type II secretion system protein N [Xanthomonas euvesicatoria pv. euvesicatoria]|uniref:type II secretion system protein N n=1 Tax=Xanthomonas euvesicatoria TaxID=456327 RepID=UPI003B67F448
MTTTLLLLPADAAAQATAVRVDAQGQVQSMGQAATPPGPSARNLLVVSGVDVHLRWLSLPGRSIAQSRAAARLQSTQLHLLLVDGAQRGIRNAQGQLLVRQPGGVALIDLALQLQQVDLLFDATGCVQAHGRVSLQLLASGAGELPGLPPLRLSGQPACVDHTAVLTLLPDTALPAGMQAEAQLQLWPDGRWQLQSRVDPAQDAVLGVGLQLLGFAAAPERGMVRNDHGQLR